MSISPVERGSPCCKASALGQLWQTLQPAALPHLTTHPISLLRSWKHGGVQFIEQHSLNNTQAAPLSLGSLSSPNVPQVITCPNPSQKAPAQPQPSAQSGPWGWEPGHQAVHTASSTAIASVAEGAAKGAARREKAFKGHARSSQSSPCGARLGAAQVALHSLCGG